MDRPKRIKRQSATPAAKKPKPAAKKKKAKKAAADKGIMVADSRGGAFYELESIIGKRNHKKCDEYLVRWKGCGPEEDSWEPAAHLCDTAWEEAAAFEEAQAAAEELEFEAARARVQPEFKSASGKAPKERLRPAFKSAGGKVPEGMVRPAHLAPRIKRTAKKSILLAGAAAFRRIGEEEEEKDTQKAINFKKPLKKRAKPEVDDAKTALAATPGDDETVKLSPTKPMGESKESVDADAKPAAKEEVAMAVVVVVEEAVVVSSPAAEVTAVVVEDSLATAVVATEVEAEKTSSAMDKNA